MAPSNFLYRLPYGVLHDCVFYFLDILDITRLESSGKIALNRELKKLAKCPMRLNGCNSLYVPTRVLDNLYKRWYFLDRVSLVPGDKSLDFCRARHLQVQAMVIKSLTMPVEGTFQEKMILQFGGKDFKYLHCTNRFIRDIKFLKGASVQKVQHLSFSQCYELSEFCPEIIKQFTSLNQLCLSYCYQLSDTELIRILQNAPLLTSLDISHCEMISNASMREIVASFPNLQKLDVTGCHMITMRFISCRTHDVCKLLKVAEYTPPPDPPLQTVRALNQWHHWVLAVFYSLEYALIYYRFDWPTCLATFTFLTLWFHYCWGLAVCFSRGYCYLMYTTYLIMTYFALLFSVYFQSRLRRFALVYRFTLMLLLVFGWLLVPTVLLPILIEDAREDLPRYYRVQSRKAGNPNVFKACDGFYFVKNELLLMADTRTQSLRACMAMTCSLCIHFFGYECARAASITMLAAKDGGLGNEALPLTIALGTPFSGLILYLYTNSIVMYGSRITMRISTIACVITLAIVTYLYTLKWTGFMGKLLTIYFYAFREIYVSLLSTQQWAFIATSLDKSTSSYIVKFTAAVSIASTFGGFGVEQLVAFNGVQSLMLCSVVCSLFCGIIADVAFYLRPPMQNTPIVHSGEDEVKSSAVEESENVKMQQSISSSTGTTPPDSSKSVDTASLADSQTATPSVAPEAPQKKKRNFFVDSWNLFWKHYILQVLFVEGIMHQLCTNMLNLMFHNGLRKEIVDDKIRAIVVGRFFATVNMVVCTLQIFVLPSILSQATLPKVLTKLPMIVLGTAAYGVLYPGIYAVLIGFGTIKVLEYSVMTASSEMIYVDMGHEVRYLGKELVRYFGHKMGKSAASLVLSGLIVQFDPSLSTQSLWSAGMALTWAYTMYGLANHLWERNRSEVKPRVFMPSTMDLTSLEEEDHSSVGRGGAAGGRPRFNTAVDEMEFVGGGGAGGSQHYNSSASSTGHNSSCEDSSAGPTRRNSGSRGLPVLSGGSKGTTPRSNSAGASAAVSSSENLPRVSSWDSMISVDSQEDTSQQMQDHHHLLQLRKPFAGNQAAATELDESVLHYEVVDDEEEEPEEEEQVSGYGYEADAAWKKMYGGEDDSAAPTMDDADDEADQRKFSTDSGRKVRHHSNESTRSTFSMDNSTRRPPLDVRADGVVRRRFNSLSVTEASTRKPTFSVDVDASSSRRQSHHHHHHNHHNAENHHGVMHEALPEVSKRVRGMSFDGEMANSRPIMLRVGSMHVSLNTLEQATSARVKAKK